MSILFLEVRAFGADNEVHGNQDKEHGSHEEDKRKDEHNDGKEETDHGEEHAHSKNEKHGKDEEDHEVGEEHGDEGHEDSGFGDGKAIRAVKNGGVFQLSPESEKFLKVQTNPVGQIVDGKIRIKKEYIVEYKSELGIFLKNEGWFRLAKAEIISESEVDSLIKVVGLNPQDLLVVRPLGTLRAAHLQATGQGGKGHAH